MRYAASNFTRTYEVSNISNILSVRKVIMSLTIEKRQTKTYVPNESDSVAIDEFIRQFQKIQDKKATLTSAGGAQVIELPEPLFDVLRHVADALSNGNGVTVAPQETKLTTQSAADFLGMSRPTLVKLLESGEIPFELVGRHRRVTLRDLVDYKAKFRVERRAVLRKMARDGQEAGLLDLTSADMQERS